MIPLLAGMVGLYIITRMVQILSRWKTESGPTLMMSVFTLTLSIISLILIFMSSKELSKSLDALGK